MLLVFDPLVDTPRRREGPTEEKRSLSDEPDSLILRLLRRIDDKVDRLIESVGDLKGRVTSLEERTSRVQAELASIHSDFAGQSVRIDRIEGRLERIERRLDLSETA
jgi:chromosome segregation ATPase